jgi:hypothetical protein
MPLPERLPERAAPSRTGGGDVLRHNSAAVGDGVIVDTKLFDQLGERGCRLAEQGRV